MSVAFVKEDSAEVAQEVPLPDRAISPYPNLVTASGLKALEAAEAKAQAEADAARLIEDANERRRAREHAERDLRYFHERLLSAQLRPDPQSPNAVVFGARVTFERDGARRQTYRIVGEDEAEPRAGSISYVAPLARALMGKRVGDVIELDGHEVEIIAIA